ncbi:hypothetical protein NDA13_006421 [Ustilago tritici]|nr:hypothetical protein NDA13_006421 [Ustilago tritici]
MVQNHYHRLINDNTYGTPKEPKVGLVFEYTRRTNVKQVVTPLTIMIKCVATLYYVMHDLGPFCSRFELKWQMRAHVTLSIANKKRDATHILHFMTEDPRYLEVTAAALEEELNAASSEGGNVMQDSRTDKASDVAQTLTNKDAANTLVEGFAQTIKNPVHSKTHNSIDGNNQRSNYNSYSEERAPILPCFYSDWRFPNNNGGYWVTNTPNTANGSTQIFIDPCEWQQIERDVW